MQIKFMSVLVDDQEKALYEAGIPAIALISRDIQAEFNRLSQRGIVFRGEPQNYSTITTVLFEDTCGNLINLVQPMV
jgi:hypothetical protein